MLPTKKIYTTKKLGSSTILVLLTTLLTSRYWTSQYSDRSTFVSNYLSDHYFSLQKICCNWNNHIRFLNQRYQNIYFLTFYNIVLIDTYHIDHKYYIPFISIIFFYSGIICIPDTKCIYLITSWLCEITWL